MLRTWFTFVSLQLNLLYISNMSQSSKSSSMLSTFCWQKQNIHALLRPIAFRISKANDSSQPFCHHTHKNLNYKQAPFLGQKFRIQMDQLTNIKYLCIDNYTNGSEMTISIAAYTNSQTTEVYRDKYICKGKTLKQELKRVDLGALPCQVIQISVQKGCKISSKNISLIGVESADIEQKLGHQYFKLLVVNPLKIIYSE